MVAALKRGLQRVRGVFTTRRYTNTRLPYPYLYLTYSAHTT